MNAVTIKIELPPESQALIKNLQQMPDELPQAIKRGMDRALSVVRGRIQENRLSGKGPFPPSEHRLGIVSQQLQRSAREEPAVIVGNTVTGAIGSHVRYAAIHEFGFQGEETVKPHTRGGHVAKRIGFKYASGKTIIGGYTRNMNMPERAPFRTGITENADYIAGEIGSEIDKSLENLNK